jgi:hypothetical protein
MFGRRRRVAPVVPVVQACPPELSDEQVFELLHDKLSEIVGENGAWTLVPRQSDDTEVFFHGLKAQQIASILTTALQSEKAALRGERTAEPTALPWNPAPISVWAEPERATVNAPVHLPSHEAAAYDEAMLNEREQSRLVA